MNIKYNICSGLPSLGIVKIGIWVIEPFRPSTRPALYKAKYCNRIFKKSRKIKDLENID